MARVQRNLVRAIAAVSALWVVVCLRIYDNGLTRVDRTYGDYGGVIAPKTRLVKVPWNWGEFLGPLLLSLAAAWALFFAGARIARAYKSKYGGDIATAQGMSRVLVVFSAFWLPTALLIYDASRKARLVHGRWVNGRWAERWVDWYGHTWNRGWVDESWRWGKAVAWVLLPIAAVWALCFAVLWLVRRFRSKEPLRKPL